MKNKSFIIPFLMLFCSCTSRSCQQSQREFQTSERNYQVTVYAAGVKVFQDDFHGVVNQEEGDGIYYFKGDTLIEIAGTYVIKSIK